MFKLLKTLPLIISSSVFANTMSSVIYKNDDIWEPEWFRKTIVIAHDQTFTGDKQAHWNWNMVINRSKFAFEHENFKAFQITKFKFGFDVKFNVFKQWEDNGYYELGSHELVKATEKISEQKNLNLWVKGQNNFFDFSIKAGIEEIPSAYINKNMGGGINKYNISNFQAEITYKYLINSPEEDMAEELIDDFFKKTYDWNMTNFNTGEEVVKRLTAELRKVIPEPYKDDLIVELPYKTYHETNQKENEVWNVIIRLFNGEVKPKNGNKYFQLKLNNIGIFPQEIKEIYTLFQKSSWNFKVPNQFFSYNRQQRESDAKKIVANIIADSLVNYSTIKAENIFKKHIKLEIPLAQQKQKLRIDLVIKANNQYMGTLIINNFRV